MRQNITLSSLMISLLLVSMLAVSIQQQTMAVGTTIGLTILPSNPSDIDGDGILNDVDPDMDGDGILNQYDTDVDGDGTANSTDTDDDNDGILDGTDTFPLGFVGPTGDVDNDGILDIYDADIDGDGVFNHLDADVDGDGILNTTDTDDDNDGRLDGVDSSPLGPLVGDMDADGISDLLDYDIDGDGVANGIDTDVDGDGILNTIDTDDDNDGILDGVDTTPLGRILPVINNGGGGGGGGSSLGGSILPPVTVSSGTTLLNIFTPNTGNMQSATGLIQDTGLLLPKPTPVDPYKEQSIDPEVLSAYEWARKNGITSMQTAYGARLYDSITRAELAKMMSVFATKVMGRIIISNPMCDVTKYSDYNSMDVEQQFYITQACNLGIMGWSNATNSLLPYFNPKGLVNRAQFGTVLSRFLYGQMYNGDASAERYVKHLQALNKDGIMKIISEPSYRELRGYVMIMMQRIGK